MLDFFDSPRKTATSASVEGDFGHLKKRILKNEVSPMRADAFIVTHLRAIQGLMKVTKSKLETADPGSKRSDQVGNRQSTDAPVVEEENVDDPEELEERPEAGMEEENEEEPEATQHNKTDDECETWRGLTNDKSIPSLSASKRKKTPKEKRKADKISESVS